MGAKSSRRHSQTDVARAPYHHPPQQPGRAAAHWPLAGGTALAHWCPRCCMHPSGEREPRRRRPCRRMACRWVAQAAARWRVEGERGDGGGFWGAVRVAQGRERTEGSGVKPSKLFPVA